MATGKCANETGGAMSKVLILTGQSPQEATFVLRRHYKRIRVIKTSQQRSHWSSISRRTDAGLIFRSNPPIAIAREAFRVLELALRSLTMGDT